MSPNQPKQDQKASGQNKPGEKSQTGTQHKGHEQKQQSGTQKK